MSHILCQLLCVADLRKQMESSELRNQRLKEVFQRKIQEFRTVCYILTGYQIDITTENQYRLTSVYAEHMEDSLLFKKVCKCIRGDKGETNVSMVLILIFENILYSQYCIHTSLLLNKIFNVPWLYCSSVMKMSTHLWHVHLWFHQKHNFYNI